MRSPARGSGTTFARFSDSGSTASGTQRAVEIGLGTNLIGTDDLVRERLRRYLDAGIATLRVGLETPGGRNTMSAQLDQLGRLLDVVRDVNREASARVPER
jgi:alkanesulfonate monooxygenase SsuD/methylene tetrahydromethanopterin reductase-like flavin-dependent oxidoreductase (luciferase family)